MVTPLLITHITIVTPPLITHITMVTPLLCRSSKQEHLIQHSETITALTHCADKLASCSGALKLQPSQICIWNPDTYQLLHTCSYHEHQVTIQTHVMYFYFSI